MNAPVELVNAAPVAALVVFAVLRRGPAVVVTLVAGVIAVLSRDRERGERALEVLRLVHRPAAPRRRPGRRVPLER
ncbi:hypothetical protein [Saccharothrix syringae]|uniref:Uncharacterized protein n=1 Tax=Saccharothrix syringae TaxID=103733 RepID=A0A5Q0H2S8_SACSY|nr:hypothetical protein [Saccharothrix syringae]QFZ20012.1 hypothetical protein EKG83_23610 [Saccharothrix syringae]